MKYVAVCFDLDGVIINSEPLHEAAFRSALKNYNLPLSEDDYKAHFAGKTDQQGFIDYLSSLDVEISLSHLLSLKQEAYASLAPDKLTYYEGIPSLVRDLANISTLALVTGSSPEESNMALQNQHLTNYFSVIVTANDITHGKPSPEGYLQAASRLGGNVTASACIAVEDSPSGVLAAKRAGMYCIAVTHTHTAEMLHMADAVVSRLDLDTFTQLINAQKKL